MSLVLMAVIGKDAVVVSDGMVIGIDEQGKQRVCETDRCKFRVVDDRLIVSATGVDSFTQAVFTEIDGIPEGTSWVDAASFLCRRLPHCHRASAKHQAALRSRGFQKLEPPAGAVSLVGYDDVLGLSRLMIFVADTPNAADGSTYTGQEYEYGALGVVRAAQHALPDVARAMWSRPDRTALVNSMRSALAAATQQSAEVGGQQFLATVSAGRVTANHRPQDRPPIGGGEQMTVGCAGLGALDLPLRELRRFFVKVTNVAGEVRWAEVGIDRNAVSDGAGLTITDFNVEPVLLVNFDGTIDEVVFTVPSGKTLTFPGLAGAASSRQYVVGATILDDGSHESVMSPEESRFPYTIQVTAGGVTRTVWFGPLHGVIAAAVPNGTVAVNSNGAYQWTVDGPTVQDSITYAESTSAYPSDATALAGTSISGRVCTRTGGGPLTFGQTVFVSIASYDSHGNVIQIMHLRGAYQTFTATRTTSFGVGSFIEKNDVAGGVPAHGFVVNGSLQPNGNSTFDPQQEFGCIVVLPDGTTITDLFADVYSENNGSSGGSAQGHTTSVRFDRISSTGGVTNIANAVAADNGGWQTLHAALSESTTGQRYNVRWLTSQGSAPSTPSHTRLAGFYLTQTIPNPATGV